MSDTDGIRVNEWHEHYWHAISMGNEILLFALSSFSLKPLNFSWFTKSHTYDQEKMADIQLCNTHTLGSHGLKVARVHIHDWFILLLLVGIEVLLNAIDPFYRFVGKDMMTDLKYPFKKSTVPLWAVPVIAVVLPFIIFSVIYYKRRDVYDLHHAILGLLYAVLITGVVTDAIKDAVGRPRPDFFWRCFPDGKEAYDPMRHGDVICHGDKGDIKEGHKSFPSGHSSWSFAGLGFLAWYLSGKIQAFDRKGHIAKLCIIFLPLLGAAIIAISRVDDYWHHWQDVFAGGLLGLVVASLCYLQFFPPPYDAQGWGPYAYFRMLADQCRDTQLATTQSSLSSGPHDSSECRAVVDMVDSSPVLHELETGRKL